MYHAIGSPEFASKCDEDPVCYRFGGSESSDASYSPGYLPTLYINGVSSTSTEAYKTDATAMRDAETAVTMSLEGTTFDSLTANIKLAISSDEDLSGQDLRLFVAVTMDSIAYNGSNGETEHHDVFLGWVNTYFGGDTLVLAKDDTVKKTYQWALRGDYPKNSYFPKDDSEMTQVTWDKKNMTAVAFVQKKSDYEILQAVQLARKNASPSTNTAPTISTISDLTINEDETGTVELSATDAENNAITFSATSSTSESVTTSISSNTLTIKPDANWNGESTITVTASDGSLTSSTSFKLTVTAVNDAPAVFDLEKPMNNASVKITNQLIGDSLEFSWRASSDVEGDDITYLWVGSNGLDSVKVASVKNTTSLTITYSVLHDAIDWSENSEISGSWTISATDGTVHTKASNGPYTLTLSDKVQDVSGENLQPLEFSLLQNYPNPFNSGTTINYILPENSDVEIVIYTLLGHPVKTLVNKRVNSGFHAVSWDGKDDSGNTVSGGIYLYRIRATNFTAVRKMLLLK